MPHAERDERSASPTAELPDRLPFPPVTKSHIMHCSVHHWHNLYKTLTPKTRLVPLSSAFISYLRADTIFLPPEDYIPSSSIEPQEDEDDPSQDWPEIHTAIKSTINELGGKVYPKLNWSAPKDATFIAATNSMECSTPNDIYLLFKSSDFITHDLEQAFVDCEDEDLETGPEQIPYTLVLRKAVPAMINSMEFRCFVRRRRLIGVCQRDLNHYEFMEGLVPILQELIYDFFEEKLKDTFPDDSYVFDVYIPKPVDGGRVWLIDINPWAPRTDSLLFSWLELLTMADLPAEDPEPEITGSFIRLSLRDGTTTVVNEDSDTASQLTLVDDGVEDLPFLPEVRIVKRGDPETYSFNAPLYGAHKLPKDVVDAGMAGEGGIRDFLNHWERIQADSGYDSNGEKP